MKIKIDETRLKQLVTRILREGLEDQGKYHQGFQKFPCVMQQGWQGLDLDKDGVFEIIAPGGVAGHTGENKRYHPDGTVEIMTPTNTGASSNKKTKYRCQGNKVVIDSFVKNPKGWKPYKGSPFIKDASGMTVMPYLTTDQGSTGKFVTNLQAALIKNGWLNIKAPTGFYGRMTQAAILTGTKVVNPGAETNQARGITQEVYNQILKYQA